MSVDRATSNEKKDLKSLFCVGIRNEAGFVCGFQRGRWIRNDLTGGMLFFVDVIDRQKNGQEQVLAPRFPPKRAFTSPVRWRHSVNITRSLRF